MGTNAHNNRTWANWDDCCVKLGSPRSRNRQRTFSRGWSRHEPVEKLRKVNGSVGSSPLRSNLESSSGMGSMPSIATSGASDSK